MSGSRSADRFLSILDLFTEERLEWTSEEMMVALGYSRPTLYRYLKPLRNSGFLTSLPNAGFTLGPRVVEMDFLMRKSDSLVCHGRKTLISLSKRYPCSAQLVRYFGEKLLCVASECSTPNPISSYPRGRPMPISRGAISRAIMANLPRRQLVPIVEANLPELAEIGLGQSVEEIVEGLRPIRRDGIAVAYGEVTPNVVGIAAPVFDAGRAPIATLSVTLSQKAISAERLQSICSDVKAGAETLSAELSTLRNKETEGDLV